MNALLDVDSPRYVTVENAMLLTGRSRRTIHRWVRDGKVRWTRFEGRLMVEAADIDHTRIRCATARLANLRRP